MALDFPNAPTNGMVYGNWVWDGTKWVINIGVAPGTFPDAPSDGQFYARGSQVWVPALRIVGGTLTGPLTLSGDPANPLHAATKQYSDTKLPIAGGTLTGPLTLSADPTNPLHAATKQYSDTKLSLTGGTLTGLLVVNASNTLGLRVSRNTAAVPTPLTDTIAYFAGTDATIARITVGAFGSSPNLTFRRSNGTAAIPTAIAINDALGSIVGMGYSAAGYSVGRASIDLIASEAWSNTAQGTRIELRTTTPGTTTLVTPLTLNSVGASVAGTVTATGSAAFGTTVPSGSVGGFVSVFATSTISGSFVSGGYYNGGWKHWSGGSANFNMLVMDGNVSFYTAPPGAADSAVVASERFRINNSDGACIIYGTLNANNTFGVATTVPSDAQAGNSLSGWMTSASINRNAYVASSYTWKYQGAGTAMGMQLDRNSVDFAVVSAPNGAAGGLLTWVERLRVQNSDGACLNGTGSWTTLSDKAVKLLDSIKPYERGLKECLALSPVQYRYAPATPFTSEHEPGPLRLGLMAQDVEPHIPEIVGETIAMVSGKKLTVKTLNNGDLVFVLLNAVKELNRRIDELENPITDRSQEDRNE